MRDRSVYEQALRLLEYRPRSVAELRRKLLQKGNPPTDTEAVIQRLLEQGLLNDGDYALNFARSRTGGGASRFRIAQELARKGVQRDAAERALNALAEDEGIDPLDAARRLAAKKWKSVASLDPRTRDSRMYAFLARRGFNPDEIRRLIRDVRADPEGDAG